MKTTRLTLTSYLIGFFLSHTVAASEGPLLLSIPTSMLVITAFDKPIHNKITTQKLIKDNQGTFSIYYLNAINNFENNLSQALPANEQQAKQYFQQHLNKIGKDNFKQQLLTAYQALLTAIRYQINRYPAIIIDKQVVIYGVTDLQQALRHYTNWKDQQHDSKQDQGGES